MGFQPEDAPAFDPGKTIREQFGDNVAFVIVVHYDKHEIELRRNPNCSYEQAFPLENITLEEPTQITVIPWEQSPGCRGCVVNGRWYPCCPV